MRGSLPDLCGRMFAYNEPAPGAGSLVEIIVPAGERWRIRSLRFRLVTSAAVATRYVHVDLNDGVALHTIALETGGQAASLSYFYTCVAGYGSVAVNVVGEYILPLPTWLFFKYGMDLIIDAFSLQAGDQFSLIYMIGEKWIDNEIIG